MSERYSVALVVVLLLAALWGTLLWKVHTVLVERLPSALAQPASPVCNGTLDRVIREQCAARRNGRT